MFFGGLKIAILAKIIRKISLFNTTITETYIAIEGALTHDTK